MPRFSENILQELKKHQAELESPNNALCVALDAFEESVERHIDLYDQSPVGYFTVSERGLILQANITAATLLGTQRQALFKQPITRFISKADRNIYALSHKQLIQAAKPQDCELRMLNSDGVQFWAHLLSSAARDTDGAPVIRIVLTNITESKQLENTLALSEQKYRLLFENSRDALMIISLPSWTFTGANQAALNMFGASSLTEFLAHMPWEYSPQRQPDGRLSSEKAQEINSTILRAGFHRFEWEHRRLDGVLFTADVLLSYVEMGSEQFLQGTVRDITERKQVDVEMLAMQNQLQATLAAIPDLLFEVGLDGRIFDYHSPRTELLAAPPEIFLGKLFFEFLPLDVSNVCMSAILEANENGFSIGKQYELQLSQGKFWFELSVSIKSGLPGQDPRFIMLARDITERRLIELQLQKLSAHLAIVREEEKSHFAREIHDELGSILTAMKMEIFLQKTALSANESALPLLKHTKSIETLVKNATGFMRQIINDLRPSILSEFGLKAALKNQIAQFIKSTRIECDFDYLLDADDETRLLDLQSINLFRILQEAFTNIRKHSHASKVYVEVLADAENITML
jgi:PAS domain S-box-containing protein